MKIPATWTEQEIINTSSVSTSSCSSGSKKSRRNKPQQCLRFAPTVEVLEIPNRSEYSQEELEASWFQGADYEEFRENCYMTMGLYRAGLLPNGGNSNHTMRGLEGRLQDASKQREWTRFHATSAVLNEQYRQYSVRYWNPQAIADLYHSVTWKSQYSAYTQAMLDEQEQRSLTHQAQFKLPAAASPRRSEPKNLLRKVIDIERSDIDSSCSMQFATLPPASDFDLSAFFQEMTVSAQ